MNTAAWAQLRAVQRPTGMYWPDDWLDLFDADFAMTSVFWVHAFKAREENPDAYLDLPEREGAKFSRVDTKTFHAKRKQLVGFGLLEAKPGCRGGRAGIQYRVHWMRLAELVACGERLSIRKKSKPAQTQQNEVNFPHSEQANSYELNEGSFPQECSRFPPNNEGNFRHPYKEVTIAAKNLKLQLDSASPKPPESEPEQATAIKSDLSERNARSGICRHLGHADRATERNLVAAFEPVPLSRMKDALEAYEEKCRILSRNQQKVGWGYVVQVAKGIAADASGGLAVRIDAIPRKKPITSRSGMSSAADVAALIGIQ